MARSRRKIKGFYRDEEGRIRPITAAKGRLTPLMKVRIPAQVRKRIEANFKKMEQQLKKERLASEVSNSQETCPPDTLAKEKAESEVPGTSGPSPEPSELERAPEVPEIAELESEPEQTPAPLQNEPVPPQGPGSHEVPEVPEASSKADPPKTRTMAVIE